MSIAQQIKQELARIYAIEPERITDETWLIDLGLDSLRIMELVLVLEDHFDIELRDEAIARLQTVSDLVKLIEGQLIAKKDPNEAAFSNFS
jgi:acyl carrier protein